MHIIHFTAGANKVLKIPSFPEVFTREQVLNVFKNFSFDRQLVLYDDLRNSPEAIFTEVLNRYPIKPVLFLERKFAYVHRGLVGFRTWFGSVHPDTRSYPHRIGPKHSPPKQTKEISFAYKIQQTLPDEG